ALTLGLRRRMRCGRRHPETVPFVTEGDRLAPRQPNGAVERRAEAQPILARDDEPAAPAHDWLGVVGRARSAPDLYAGTFSGSRGASVGSFSGASSGVSRGTGSSSGSTVTVRRGSPIFIAPRPCHSRV